MSWRTVIITGVAKLDYKMEYLVVRKVDSIKRVHLSEWCATRQGDSEK